MANPSRLDKIQITANSNSATATKVNVQEANGEVNTQTINTGFNKNIGLGGSDVVGANTLLNQYSTTPVDWTATTFDSGQVVFYAGKQWIAKIATVAGDVPSVSSKWEEITFEALANKTTTVDQTIIDGSTNAVSGNAVFDSLVLKAPLASPSLTGTPTAPTATAGANTTQVATTAFVTNGIATAIYKRTIAEIRALTGTLPRNNFYTTDIGQEGNWYYDASDTTSDDNTGTILVTSDGKRIKRSFSGAVSVKWFGAKGNGANDDTIPITNSINAYSDVFFPIGTYVISSTISVLNKSNLTGSGTKSLISTNGDFNAFTISSTDISIRDLAIAGLGRGTGTNYATTRPNNNGIYIDGTAVKKTSIILENLILYSLGNAGIYIKNNLSPTFAPNIVATNLNTSECLVGYWFDERAEYSTFSNCVVNSCEYGIRMRGGNNNYNGGGITNCRTGVYFKGGLNDAHSVFSGTAINHSIDYSVNTNGVANGHLFSGCMLYYGDIYFNSSNMIKFMGCDFYTPNIYADASTKCEFISNKFTLTPSLSLAFLGNQSDVRFMDNSIPTGGFNATVLESTLTGGINSVAPGNPYFYLKSTNANASNRNWGFITNYGAWGDFDLLKSSVIGGVPDTSVLNIKASTGVVKIDNLSGTGTRTVVANASGNLSATDAAARPYKVYTALLTQIGNAAPTATVLENTLGGTVVWSRTGTGVYTATLNGAFPLGKTTVMPFFGTVNGGVNLSQTISGVRIDNNSVGIRTSAGMTLTDVLLLNATIEIRVYN